MTEHIIQLWGLTVGENIILECIDVRPEKELDEELTQELRVNLTRLRIRPVFRDLLITLVGQAIVLASGLLVYRLAATYLAPNGVGEYALARRVNSFLQLLGLLRLGVGLQPLSESLSLLLGDLEPLLRR